MRKRTFMEIAMTVFFGSLCIAATVASFWEAAIWFPVAFTMGGFAVASWVGDEEEMRKENTGKAD